MKSQIRFPWKELEIGAKYKFKYSEKRNESESVAIEFVNKQIYVRFLQEYYPVRLNEIPSSAVFLN